MTWKYYYVIFESPPSTWITSPVIQSGALLTNHEATSPTSEAIPILPDGFLLLLISLAASEDSIFEAKGVSVSPGETTFILIPLFAYSEEMI